MAVRGALATVMAVALALAAGETLRLRVLLGRSSVEVFAQDGRVVLTDRVYPDTASVGLRSWRLLRPDCPDSHPTRTPDEPG